LSAAERGSSAVDAGDLETARSCFLEAVRAEARNPRHRFHLAVVLEGLGEIDAAAAALTEALRLDRGFEDAARRLSALANRYAVTGDAALDAAGLQAALRRATVDREIIAELAMAQLAGRGPLKDALAAGIGEGWAAVARRLCARATGPLLKNALFLDVLGSGAFRHADAERLLTALRCVLLLETRPERFADRTLVAFAIALMRQCWANEHVWAVSAEEMRAIAASPIAMPRLLGGDLEEGRRLLLAALYRPLPQILGSKCQPGDLARVAPRALRDAVSCHIAELADERSRAARIESIGSGEDATGRAVAQQYEANPYPRWSSVALPRAGSLTRTLLRFFTDEELAFVGAPFEVLIAGCGTGQQAVRAAMVYGSAARVLGLDLSLASLAYGARMAEGFGAANLEFLQGDILQLAASARFRGRFRIVECTGVLHHLADPFLGWRALISCLAPGGLMLVGLYSALSRRNIARLRSDPQYPGAGCDDDALRAFRGVLRDRGDAEAGGELKSSRDFYTTSNFRDLALHVSERPVGLEEIARFLEDNGLSFRGFVLPRQVFADLQRRFPEEVWPGRLERWAEFEVENPRLFDAMYMLWCVKRD
jgi:SAM-dependent methyltransferase